MQAGLAERETDSDLAVDYSGACGSGRNSQSHKSPLESGARDEQVSCTVPSLAPPPQAVPQCSKEISLPG